MSSRVRALVWQGSDSPSPNFIKGSTEGINPKHCGLRRSESSKAFRPLTECDKWLHRSTRKNSWTVFVFGRSLFRCCGNTASRTNSIKRGPEFKCTRSESSLATLPLICRPRLKLFPQHLQNCTHYTNLVDEHELNPLMTESRSTIVNVARTMIVNKRLAMREGDTQSCKHVQVLSYLSNSFSCQLVTPLRFILKLVGVGCWKSRRRCLTHCTSPSRAGGLLHRPLCGCVPRIDKAFIIDADLSLERSKTTSETNLYFPSHFFPNAGCSLAPVMEALIYT